MAELADAPDLGSGVYVRGGSSPFTRTNKKALAGASAFSVIFASWRAILPYSNNIADLVV